METNNNEIEGKAANNLSGFPDTYLSLDVETPNRKNDRISQIGLLLIQNGNVIEDHSSLINPETYFAEINTEITGIDEEKVAHAPTLAQYWPSVKDLFEKYVVVAHNAAFDLTVLYKALVSYSIDFPKIYYVCTCQESMQRLPELKHFSLKALSEHFGIPLGTQHDAGSDAEGCSLLFEKMKSQGFSFTPELFKASIKNQISRESEIIRLPYFIPEESELTGLRFVITGHFTMIPKKDLKEFIESHGGKVVPSVTSVTNYLIVGSSPEPAWKHGSYGNKIEKAIKLILEKQNKKLRFVSEKDFIEKYIPNCKH